MNRLRQGRGARISFFSFQDIITSVTGILILVTLILSFSIQSAGPTEQDELAETLRSLREKLARTESENQLIQNRSLSSAELPDAVQLQAAIAQLELQMPELEAARQQSQASFDAARQRISSSAGIEKLRAELAELEQRRDELQVALAREGTNSNVLFVVPAAAKHSAKAPVAIVVGASGVEAQRLNGAEAFRAETLKPILSRFDSDRDLLVFFFRPSGAKWFDEFREEARRAGFEIGYDAIEEEKQIVFRTP